MPRLYSPHGDAEECDDCGTELVFLKYRSGYLGCPECIPDGLLDAYGAEV